MIIKATQPGTSPRHIKHWIKRIKHAHLIKIDQYPFKPPEQATNIMSNVIKHSKTLMRRVSQYQHTYVHQDNGLPMLYFDQLSTISRHLENIKSNSNSETNGDMT